MEFTKRSILDLLIREGHSLSKQRLFIIDTLWEQQGVDNVEDFWLSLRKKETIGWATVHKTLSILEYLGCLTRLSSPGRHKRYLLNLPKNTD